MSSQPYMASPEVFNDAVNAIIDAELRVASGRGGAESYYVVLERKSGSVVITPIDWVDKETILLWKVDKARSISDIKAMIYESKGAPFYGDSWVEWYLKRHFDGVINWNFDENLACEYACENPTVRVLKASDKSVWAGINMDGAVLIDEE